ncbi:hypothetical protein BDN70DRAFT_901533 [Pholiota conissans]|uniref:Reverse transcriptase/retrotransposon-derived protein RNase H-like domain-containing protein n=1 Tax=Pholiota conissans TaxID=109636 RepID=A0A9P5YLW0_9AGAR|nr:hypothetical protein BDN70DRAFT_901533 [Pholiota conissans]
MPGKPYRIYTDACDFTLAGILQQVQPIRIRELKDTKMYEHLERAYQKGEDILELATKLSKEDSDIPVGDKWGKRCKVLALKEGLIKFQHYLEDGPIMENIPVIPLSIPEDPLRNMFSELGVRFEQKLLSMVEDFAREESIIDPHVLKTTIEWEHKETCILASTYQTLLTHRLLINIGQEEQVKWINAYVNDVHYNKVKKDVEHTDFPQYHFRDNGLIFFQDLEGNTRLCVPKELQPQVMKENHDVISEGAHAGYFKTYN